MSWRQLEQLVGEAYRRQGYAVTENGQGGADGGVDLILKLNGQTTLVQCKQWRQRKVGVNIVREQYGLLSHHQAQRAIIVTAGEFTPDARQFAAGKPIELIEGSDLMALVASVQRMPASAQMDAVAETPADAASHPLGACPKCGAEMVERKARKTGNAFLGCSRFPQCRGTLEAPEA